MGAYTNATNNGGTTLDIVVPDESAEYAFTSPQPAGAVIIAVASTNPATTPSGWTLTPGAYSAYDPVTKNVFSEGDVVLRFYIGPPGDGVAEVTFDFGTSTEAMALAFGTPSGLLDPAGGPDGSVRTVQADAGTIVNGFGNGWLLDHDFTMRGTAAFGIVFTGDASAQWPSANNFEDIAHAFGPPGPVVGNMALWLFISIDIGTNEPWPIGTDIGARLQGHDDPADLTYLHIFEFGAPADLRVGMLAMRPT